MRKISSGLLLGLCLCLGLVAPVQGEFTSAIVEEQQEVLDEAIAIYDRAGLEAIASNPSGSYVLASDIDMGRDPWMPIPFSGHLDGAGYAILNLTVRGCDPTTEISVDGNAKKYDTVFAALFSRTYGAVIERLALLGIDVDVAVEQNAFAAGLVGYAEDTQITGCTVVGKVKLEMTDRMCGVAGIIGFGYGTIIDCVVDSTLTLVDANHEIKCEEFMGGAFATGYADVSGCDVRVRAYTSVYGYVHNGGIAGMYYVHGDEQGHRGYVRDNIVDAEIYFFEANNDRRAYCDPYVGERLDWNLQISGNTTVNFVNGETRDYTKNLSPEQCDTPDYAEAVTAPDCTSFGYTTYTCNSCHYEYNEAYTLPAHTPGEWEMLHEPTSEESGVRRLVCMACGEILDEEALAMLSPEEGIGTPASETMEAAPKEKSFPVVAAVLFIVAALLLIVLFKSS